MNQFKKNTKENKKHEKFTSTKLKDLIKFDDVIDQEKLLQRLPFFTFLFALCIIYIWNAHYAEKTVREINVKQKELNELRWEYMSSKSELMYKSKQSEVAKLVEPFGIKPLVSPPKKILIKE